MAALNSLCIFVGWLCPAYSALQRCQQAALAVQPAGRGRAASFSSSGPESDGGGARQPPAGRRPPPAVDTAAEWLLSNVFLQGAPAELQITAWCVLGALCWLYGALLAILTAPDC